MVGALSAEWAVGVPVGVPVWLLVALSVVCACSLARCRSRIAFSLLPRPARPRRALPTLARALVFAPRHGPSRASVIYLSLVSSRSCLDTRTDGPHLLYSPCLRT